MKQTHFALLGVAALLAAPICLQAADAPPATETRATATDTKSTPATDTKAEGTAKPAKPVYCQSSGRIKVRADSKNGCESAQKPYRSYSREQIDTTGKIDVASALEELDPIFHPN
jgi:hypothetical protein